MNFGVSARGWATQSDPTFFARVATVGFDGIELHVRVPADLTILRDTRERLREVDLRCTVAGEADDSLDLEPALFQLIDACTVLDARTLCAPFGGNGDAEAVEALRSAARYGARYGLTLALGAPLDAPGAAFGSTATVIRNVDAIGSSNVGIAYNTYRAHVEETSISGAILASGRRIMYVQIAENDGAAPGGGQVRWNETFAALDAVRYDGWYIVDAKADSETNAVLGLEFLRRHRPRDGRLAPLQPRT